MLSVPPLLSSCLTGPPDASHDSATPVNTWSSTTLTVLPLQTPMPLEPAPPAGVQTLVPPVPAPPPGNDPSASWFSHGPLTRFASLCGWGRGHPTPPGSGTQSWLFCPSTSLGLAVAESRMGVPPYSTGNREQVPSEQSQFWTAHALPIIRAYADHFRALDRHHTAASLLQSWQGGHLESVAQEVVTSLDIMSMITVWLSDTVSLNSTREILHRFSQVFFQLMRLCLHHLLPLSHHPVMFLGPVTPLTPLQCLPVPPAHSLFLLPARRFGLLSPCAEETSGARATSRASVFQARGRAGDICSLIDETCDQWDHET